MIIAVCQAYRTELSSFEKLEQLIYISETEIMHFYLGPVSQRFVIHRTMDINGSSIANRVELAINCSDETGPS